MSHRPRRVRPHWWHDLITTQQRLAMAAWEADAEAESLGYPTELEEYAATHPRPTLKGFMLANARPDRHEPDQHHDQHDTEEGQNDDAAA